MLYLRAKVTIKRGQIAYAEANKCVDNARKSSSKSLVVSLEGALRSIDDRVTATLSKPFVCALVTNTVIVTMILWWRG